MEPKLIKIPIEIYLNEVYIVFADTIKEGMELLHKKKKFLDFECNSTPGALTLVDAKTRGFAILFEYESIYLNYLVHETHHLSHQFLYNVGLELSNESCEAFSYLQGHLVDKIVSYINKNDLKLKLL